MESIGTLASGVAHDLNNILAPILMLAPILREQLPPDGSELLKTIEESVQRGADIVKQVLTFARGIEGKRINLQLRHLVTDMEEIARETFPKSLTIRTRMPKDLWTVNGDSTQLHQVLLNLCINARDAMPDGGSLTMVAENLTVDDDYKAEQQDSKPGCYVVLSVADSGTGIPENIIDKIFDPFFTTKQVGKGTGLGLSTVMGIVKSHGGFVKVYSQFGKGSTFKVHLPANPDGTPGSQPAEKRPPVPSGNGEWILLVDDEPAIRKVTAKTLKRNGYNVFTAADGVQALSIYVEHINEIRVVLTDVLMPHMDGVALIRVLNKLNPDARVIASTGQGDDSLLSELKQTGIKAFLQKPYATQNLLATLHEAILG
jgi:CheY-like chemotaxis protein